VPALAKSAQADQERWRLRTFTGSQCYRLQGNRCFGYNQTLGFRSYKWTRLALFRNRALVFFQPLPAKQDACRAGANDVPADQRFTAQGVSIQGLGANAYLIKDVKTGKEFLMIRMTTGGLSVTPL
jgi:hypothetical protein